VKSFVASKEKLTGVVEDFATKSAPEALPVRIERPPVVVTPEKPKSALMAIPPAPSNTVAPVLDVEPAKSPDLVVAMRQPTDSKPVPPATIEERISTSRADPEPPAPSEAGSAIMADKQPEQIASLSVKPDPVISEKRAQPRPASKALSGYIVQIAFSDAPTAQRLAESMERRGFAVSVTEAGDRSVRVRFGNFTARDDAERQLRSLRQQGLQGIVLNLPQAFRPEAAASLP
jgi:cell division protein FtsN